MKITKDNKRQIISFCFTQFLFGFGNSAIALAVTFLQSCDFTAGQVGVITSIASFVGVISPILWGILADKIRSNYTMFRVAYIGSILVSALLPSSAGVRFMGTLLVAFLYPVSNAFRMPLESLMTAMTVEASKQVDGMEYSNVRAFISIGYAVSSFLYTPLMQAFGKGVIFYIYSGLSLITMLTARHMRRYDAAATSPLQEKIPMKDLQLSRILKDYYLMIMFIFAVLMAIPATVNTYHSYLLANIQVDTSFTGVLNGTRNLFVIAMLFTAPLMKRRFSMPMMLCGTALCYAIQTFLLAMANDVVSVVLFNGFGGLAYGLQLAAGVNYVSDLSPKGLESTCQSIYVVCTSLAGILVNFVGGKLIDAIGVRGFYELCALAGVISLVFFIVSFWVGEKLLHRQPLIPLLRRAEHEAVRDKN